MIAHDRSPGRRPWFVSLFITEQVNDARTSFLSGTWSSAFPDAAHNDHGSLRGSRLGEEVTLELMTSVRTMPCSGAGSLFVAGVVRVTRLEGGYLLFDCAAVHSGSLDAVKVE
jgi:hypothetical protein